jgi:hypothetical protein
MFVFIVKNLCHGFTCNKKFRDRLWRSIISISNQLKHLGLFEGEIDVDLAYQNALEKLNES